MTKELYSDKSEDPKVLSPEGQGTTDEGNHLIREILQTVILALILFFVVRIAVQPTVVQGPSMEPGLHTGEWVFVNKLAYDFGSPQRGDVIVFHPPSDPSEDYVKRVIGVPGDTIRLTATAVYVDNTKLNEPYIYPLAPGQAENSNLIPSLTLQPGQYFVMGDHRQDSSDSRYFGPVPRQNIIGKAQMIWWPLANWELTIPTYPNVFAGVHH